MTALLERRKLLFLAGVFQLCFFRTDSSCDFPPEIRGTWFGERTILTIAQRSYNESGSHSNGQNQVVIADCVQRQDNTYLLSAPTMIDGLIFIGYLCWSYIRVNRNVLLVYGKMANISQLSPSEPFKKPTVSSCPDSLNMFPSPPEEGAIGTYYAQEVHSVQCPFIGRHQWNYGCTSGNSTLEACKYPYDTLEDRNRCRSPPSSDSDGSHIYKCIASWEGIMGVNYLLLSKEGTQSIGSNDHFCYAYTQYANGVVKGTIQEFQCKTLPARTTDQRLQNAIILHKVPNKENCDVTSNVSAVSTTATLPGFVASLAILFML